MHVGKWLLVKHEGLIQRGIVEQFFMEDLDIRLDNGELIRRKYWEVRKIDEKKEDN